MNIEKLDPTDGPLSYENLLAVLANIYWVGRLAGGLEIILGSDDIEETHRVAQEHLGYLVDPVDGLRSGIPEHIRLRWKIASTRKPISNQGRPRE